MPVSCILPQGGTCGVPPENVGLHTRAKREVVQGWSASSTRRNTQFLYSIQNDGLTGYGVALTLTVKECPETHDEWKKTREAFFFRVRKLGFIRLHWVTEWQRRGVPHLHCAAWFDQPNMGPDCLFHWFKVSEKFGTKIQSQHSAPIDNEQGWFEYLSKHARRGLAHYQRSPENVPKGWDKTGRMWGHLGDWPKGEPIKLSMSMECYHRYRRLIRSYLFSLARATGRPSRIAYTRRMLSCPDEKLSRVKGLSEWMPQSVQIDLAVFLKTQGLRIEH